MMEPILETPHSSDLSSPRDRALISALGEHYCGVYFVRTLEGFVHNLNSPLQILWIRSEQIRQDVQRLQEELQKIDNTGIAMIAERMKQRIDSLDKGLDELNNHLSFLTKDIVSKRRSEIGPVDINEVVTDTFFILKADMFYKHQVVTELNLHENLPKLKGRFSDFCIVALHLIQNALEAMTESTEKHLVVETDLGTRGIILKVRDSGSGISSENGAHIFEPFFSTKEVFEYSGQIQRHAGLGLYHVAYLIEQNNGEISFESRPSNTTFTVQFRLPSERSQNL